MPPDQIKQFQDYWDQEFSGDLARRRRAKFVPGEAAARVHQTKEPEQKNDFDEWLARIVCFAFSVPPQWAVKAMNRATADNQSAQAEEEGLEPTKEWVKDLIDEILADEFASPDLELTWRDEDTDEKTEQAQFEARVKIGAATLNELRDSLGLDPFDMPAADRPMVLTATGYVPIEANVAGQGADTKNPSENASRKNAFLVQKYSPDQPRVPKGSPNGGEWTRGDLPSNSSNARVRASVTSGVKSGLQYAALNIGTQTDAAHIAPGPQYAADRSRYNIDPSAHTGIQQIDETTEKLLDILADTGDMLDYLPGRPQYYGTLVHAVFAAAVIAKGLRGISPLDVERSFDLPPGYPSRKKSVRPDAVLRDDVGDIIAIYDVKTGEPRLDPQRADELRAATGADPSVPIIIL